MPYIQQISFPLAHSNFHNFSLILTLEDKKNWKDPKEKLKYFVATRVWLVLLLQNILNGVF